MLTVTKMLDVLIWVEACLWKLLGVDLAPELPSSPFSWTTKSPAGTSVNVTRKLPLPIACGAYGARIVKEWNVTFLNLMFNYYSFSFLVSNSFVV